MHKAAETEYETRGEIDESIKRKRLHTTSFALQDCRSWGGPATTEELHIVLNDTS